MKAWPVVLLLAVATHAGAECVRHDAVADRHNSPPAFDGPGSFGELQDTVTLDCLTLVGTVRTSTAHFALIRDERGVVRPLSVGDFMGENTGVIVKIEPAALLIEQTIQRNGKPESVIVRFDRAAATLRQ